MKRNRQNRNLGWALLLILGVPLFALSQQRQVTGVVREVPNTSARSSETWRPREFGSEPSDLGLPAQRPLLFRQPVDVMDQVVPLVVEPAGIDDLVVPQDEAMRHAPKPELAKHLVCRIFGT